MFILRTSLAFIFSIDLSPDIGLKICGDLSPLYEKEACFSHLLTFISPNVFISLINPFSFSFKVHTIVKLEKLPLSNKFWTFSSFEEIFSWIVFVPMKICRLDANIFTDLTSFLISSTFFSLIQFLHHFFYFLTCFFLHCRYFYY